MKTLFYVSPAGFDCDGMQSFSGSVYYSRVNAERHADLYNEGSDGDSMFVSTEPQDGISYHWDGIYGI